MLIDCVQERIEAVAKAWPGAIDVIKLHDQRFEAERRGRLDEWLDLAEATIKAMRVNTMEHEGSSTAPLSRQDIVSSS